MLASDGFTYCLSHFLVEQVIIVGDYFHVGHERIVTGNDYVGHQIQFLQRLHVLPGIQNTWSEVAPKSRIEDLCHFHLHLRRF